MTASAGLESGVAPTAPVAVELPITLGQFVKVAGLAATGGEAKHLVTAGLVCLNAQVETRRGLKLRPGDIVESRGVMAEVVVHSQAERSAARRD
jgi:ribosome-associated protein